MRRLVPALALSGTLCLAACQQRGSAAEQPAPAASLKSFTERPIPAGDFVDSVGVQTHISYVDTPYRQWDRVMEVLSRLGVRHIRDGLATTPDFFPQHRRLAEAGVGCTCGIVADPRYTADFIVHAAQQSRDVEALEAPNECDAGSNCGGGGTQGVAHAMATLPALREASLRLHVPLLGPSFTMQSSFGISGNLEQRVSANNLHVYFGEHHPGSEGWGAGDPQRHRYGSLAWWKDQAEINARTLPVTITETGYRSASAADAGPGTIPEDVEADYTPRTLLLAYQAGIHRTFLYELLDEFPNTGYGLLRHDLSEKPAFTAVRNLLALLHDSGPAPQVPLRFSIAGAAEAPELHHALFAKHDGSYGLLLWLEVSSYDQEARKTIAVAPRQVTLSLPAGQVRRQVRFTPAGQLQEVALSGPSSALPVAVTEHLTYLEIQTR